MKKHEKVIHLIADLGNGGAERQLVELLKSGFVFGRFFYFLAKQCVFPLEKLLDREKNVYTFLHIFMCICKFL